MKTKIRVGIFLLIVLVACNKELNETNPVAKEPNYYPLTTGSYWVYNTYKIDSLKNEELISENDTTTIIGDTSINGYQFKVFYGKKYGHGGIKTENYLRDSLGSIVNDLGKIVFSQNNFTDTLRKSSIVIEGDTLLYMYSKMKVYTGEINLPSGVFDSVLNNQLNIVFWEEPNKPTFIHDNLFAPNVGRLLFQYAYSNELLERKSYFEERLVAYFIAE